MCGSFCALERVFAPMLSVISLALLCCTINGRYRLAGQIIPIRKLNCSERSVSHLHCHVVNIPPTHVDRVDKWFTRTALMFDLGQQVN